MLRAASLCLKRFSSAQSCAVRHQRHLMGCEALQKYMNTLFSCQLQDKSSRYRGQSSRFHQFV